jgi:hypothetical protein
VHPEAARLLALIDDLVRNPDQPVPWAPDRATTLPPAGLDPGPVPAALRLALRLAGIPLRPGGADLWGSAIDHDPAATAPILDGRRLVLPGPEALAACHAVALRPVRRWVADRFGVLVKAAPGIVLAPWHHEAILVNTRDTLLGGFAYGPQTGQRAAIHLEPGAWQLVRW